MFAARLYVERTKRIERAKRAKLFTTEMTNKCVIAQTGGPR